MQIRELVQELKTPKRSKTPTPKQPEDPAWSALNTLKEQAARKGQQMQGRLQLFMPRPSIQAQTRIDRNRKVMTQPWAWDDEGNLKQNYAQWIDQGAPGVQNEAAPILKPGRAVSPPGHNKPNADLWTSTAEKRDDNTYTSEWAEWVKYNQESWYNAQGYLYRVKPGALILSLDNDYDAETIMWIFEN